MKQLLQSLRTGEVCLTEVPHPQLTPGAVLIRNMASVLSAGTERKLAEFARKNVMRKASARPDLVRQILDKAARDGVMSAVDAVRSRLNEPVPVGYSSAGVVVQVGDSITDIDPGDRVACAGYGFACHAEIVSVPRSLVAKIPVRNHGCAGGNVSFEEAAFTTLGAIALHGIRIADVKIGDSVAVLGLGIVGQLAVQLLHAAGCRVLAFDPDSDRSALAQPLGAEYSATSPDELKSIRAAVYAQGVDSVIITADTPSNEPVELAGELARDRGVVVAVGAVGMTVPRKLYYEKELDFRISRSYGPGRYDLAYEEKGLAYPIGYVPWTQTRNMEAFLKLLSEGKLVIQPLISHRFDIVDGVRAYELISGKTGERYLGVLLTYPGEVEPKPKLNLSGVRLPKVFKKSFKVQVGLLGAGSFANRVLLPAIKASKSVQLVGICSRSGVTAQNSGRKFGFSYATASEAQLINDSEVNTIVITTPHHLHAAQVLATLRAGKHVFCEKPLCLSEPELADILAAAQASTANSLMVGYNRRFSPMARIIKQFVQASTEPMMMAYRINAGFVPRNHWIQDPEYGGGRIIGEVCHFFDFMISMCGAVPVRVWSQILPNNDRYSDDNLLVTLKFSDGSIGTVAYAANGDKSLPKERFELFTAGRVAVLEDFRRLELRHNGRVRVYRSLLRQDKGHRGEWQSFLNAITNNEAPPISILELAATSLATFVTLKSIRSGEPISLNPVEFVLRAQDQPEKVVLSS